MVTDEENHRRAGLIYWAEDEYHKLWTESKKEHAESWTLMAARYLVQSVGIA